MVKFQQAKFLISVAKLSQLPVDEGVEIAVVGRSNAGKSSVINTLTQQKKLARASKTPGRTQLINLFSLDERNRLVDLPGYGYAKVAAGMSEQWTQLINSYLATRQCLKAVVLVMDIRHPLREVDQQMLTWAEQSDLFIHLLLNKSDKLSATQQKNTLLKVQQAIQKYQRASVQLFSTLKRSGIEELAARLGSWYG